MKESKRIEKLERSLKEEEQTLESLIVKDIWSLTHANSATNITQFKSLDAKIECLIRGMGKAKVLEAERATKMVEDITSARTKIEAKLNQTAINVTREIAHADMNGLERHKVTERSAGERHQSILQKQREDEFLSSLFFSEMNDRQTNIRDAAPHTLKWIFYDQVTDDTSYIGSSRDNIPDRDAKWDNFYKWLCTESTPYWICGKLGSGKSTLMGHIVEHSRTRTGLNIWKGDGRLCIFKSFFWRPGSVLQKSILGLLRSLLYQICQAEPQLIPEILSTLPTNEKVLPVWTTRALVTGITTAFEAGDYLRICIFLDGLDKFLGDYNELLDLILKIQIYDHVKFCISSRPENHIIRRLSHCRQLHLEDLNDNDINSFISQKLRKANVHLPKIGYESASSYLTKKAEGVFLYAALVTQTVVQGADDGDDESTLLRRVTSIPMGIREVFKSLIGNLNDLQKQSLSFYLSMMKLTNLLYTSNSDPWATRKLTTIPIITLARLGSQASVTRLEKMPELCSRTEAQIRGHSAGLLEIVKLEPWLDDEISQDTWLHPDITRWLGQGEFISDENWTRRKAVGQVPPYPGIFDYERRALDWVHRSAHDFIHDSVFVQDLSVSVQPSEVTLQKVLAGYILNFALAPSVSSRKIYSGTTSYWRLQDTIEALAMSWSLSPSTVATATDCLYRVCLQCNADEFGYSELPESLMLNFAFWEKILEFDMFEYGLKRIHNIPRQALPSIIEAMAGKSDAMGPTPRERKSSMFKVLLEFLEKIHVNVELSPSLPLTTTAQQICTISDNAGVFVGIASSGRRLYLQIAGSIFVDPQGLVHDGCRKLASLQASEPLVRLICTPSRPLLYQERLPNAEWDFPWYEEIESFIKVDLNQRTATMLVNLLRNDLGNRGPLLDIPTIGESARWPLLFATEKELKNCHRIILEDAQCTEQLLDSTEKLLALACIRVHLWDLLYSIWVRLLETEDSKVNNSLTYSGGEMGQVNEEDAEGDGSEWFTDEEEMFSEEQLDEDNDSNWWTDDEESSERIRWLRTRDRMTIVQPYDQLRLDLEFNADDVSVEASTSGAVGGPKKLPLSLSITVETEYRVVGKQTLGHRRAAVGVFPSVVGDVCARQEADGDGVAQAELDAREVAVVCVPGAALERRAERDSRARWRLDFCLGKIRPAFAGSVGKNVGRRGSAVLAPRGRGADDGVPDGLAWYRSEQF
ncbi:hypothetical protein PG991_001484 [Apiospora marii]|uniref:Nephrocystin 3-like N-terminal domain-containing protein n=1 Tax=Apiospora marii TaxID=335849 RepID=A0ABR1SS64_9PEZI